ncbi:MAG: ATP-binding protein, partial [Thaumarchaeota archaeon]|nr:ATP-binding protein [Nitrososphaerota archaeon]
MNGKPDSIGRFVLGTSQVIIISKKAANGQPNGVVVSPGEKLQAASIAGLDAQVKELNRFLSGFGQKFLYKRARQSCGIVLHGGRGSGKSMLVNKLTASGWGTVHRIDPDEKLSTIREVLQKARAEQPSIVTMDGFEQLIDKERSNYKSVTRALDEFLDTLASDAEQNDELPRVVLIVTCLDYMTDIPLSLREPRALEQNIFLPYPDVGARRAILASFDLPVHPDLRDALVSSLGERTHAFNGKDLKKLEARALREGQIRDE